MTHFSCETGIGHSCGFCCGCPLVGVKGGGAEGGWVAPLAVLECGHVEMEKHAKTEIKEGPLEIQRGSGF